MNILLYKILQHILSVELFAKFTMNRYLKMIGSIICSTLLLFSLTNQRPRCAIEDIVYWPIDSVVAIDETCQILSLTRNYTDFKIKYLIDDDGNIRDDVQDDVFMPIFMKSHVSDAYGREAVRRTWGPDAEKLKMPVVFVVGTGNASSNAKVLEEADRSRDIIQLNKEDVYQAQATKEFAILALERRMFPRARIYAHIDTDVLVFPEILVNVTAGLLAGHHRKYPAIFGIILPMRKIIFRPKAHKWSPLNGAPMIHQGKYDIMFGPSSLITADAVDHSLASVRIDIVSQFGWGSDHLMAYLASVSGTKMVHVDGFSVRDFYVREQDPCKLADIATSHKWTAAELIDLYPKIKSCKNK